ncbi:hypothetical protein LCGC14_3119270, partial [marine sediment metagenome]
MSSFIAGATPPVVMPVVNRGATDIFFLPGWGPTGRASANTINANKLYYIPIYVAIATTFTQLALEVNIAAGAGSVLRMGAYTAIVVNGGIAPGILLLDAGTIAADTIGLKTIDISHTLAPGHYFLAYVSDGTPRLYGPGADSSHAAPACGYAVSGDSSLDAIIATANQSGIAAGGFPATAVAVTGAAGS